MKLLIPIDLYVLTDSSGFQQFYVVHKGVIPKLCCYDPEGSYRYYDEEDGDIFRWTEKQQAKLLKYQDEISVNCVIQPV